MSTRFYLAGITELCSNYANPALALDQLRRLAIPGDRGGSPTEPAVYRPQELSKRLGSAKVEELVCLAQAGESARTLAARYKVSASAVIRLLRENNVVVKIRKVGDETAAEMAREYTAGATMAEI